MLDAVLDGRQRRTVFFVTPSPLSLLSARERQIATLISRGLEGKEIAYRLQISEHTVAAHRRNIFRKMGIANTAQLTRAVVEAERNARNRLSFGDRSREELERIFRRELEGWKSRSDEDDQEGDG